MIKHFPVFAIIGIFFSCLYGIFNIYLEVEENSCRMTYMFGKPQYTKIHGVADNKRYPNYGLYYYYEGVFEKDIKTVKLNGAPVIFIPGNAGSYKQVRSFASVALRKAISNDQNIHLDYFTIDYNEELTGFYGGYLENQKDYLNKCIESVLKLYKGFGKINSKVVLIGHSMGGKVAQSLLTDPNATNYINTIIFIAAPLDKPVLNLDKAINGFYKTTNKFLMDNRDIHIHITNNNTDVNSKRHGIVETTKDKNALSAVKDVLLISIGGGSRDVLVRAGLTTSQFNDIHAMTSSIPKVWLSCDHLSSVWCLQLVLVINRFLFKISRIDSNNYVHFDDNKQFRMQAAANYFVKPSHASKYVEADFIAISKRQNLWYEESRRVFGRKFSNGLKHPYNKLISLSKHNNYGKLYIEVINVDEYNWLYGCVAKLLPSGKHVCEKGFSLAHYLQTIPSKDRLRTMVLLDLHNIKKANPSWTHILLSLSATSKQITVNIDIHEPTKRSFHIKTPRWMQINKKYLVNETVQGTVYHKVLVEDLDESFKSVRINIQKIACLSDNYYITTKISVPWARGFTRYHVLTEASNSGIYVNAPIASPKNYNTTSNPVSVEIFLDPVCRYSISYQFSVASTTSRIVQEFYHWLPAHLTAVLIMVLKKENLRLSSNESIKYKKPYAVFFQYTSLYIITGCRILKKFLDQSKIFPLTDSLENSFFVSLFVHSAAVVLSIASCFCVWMFLIFNGNIIFRLSEKVVNFTFVSSSVLLSIMEKFPMTLGVLTISLALSTCSGIALILACAFYFLLMSNGYRSYLEDILWKKATELIKTSFVKLTSNENENRENMGVIDENAIVDSSQLRNATLNDANDVEEEESHNGLQNFSFHIILYLLLVVSTVLNIPVTIAWLTNYRTNRQLPDPGLMPSITILGCLSVLLQLKAPNKLFGYKIVSALLYITSSLCILYCQEAIYRLNFIIAFIFVILLFQELLCRLLKCCFKNIQ